MDTVFLDAEEGFDETGIISSTAICVWICLTHLSRLTL